MTDSGPGGFNPFNMPPGGNDFHGSENDERPWYRRWSVWVLPGMVIIGAIISQFGQR